MEQSTSYTKYYKDVLGELPKIEDYYSWLDDESLKGTMVYYLDRLSEIANSEPENDYITQMNEDQKIAYEVFATHIVFIAEQLKAWPSGFPSHVQIVVNVRVIRELRWHNQLMTFRNRGVKESLKDLDTDWKVSRISEYRFLDFMGKTYSGARDKDELQEVLSLLDSFRYALFTLLTIPEKSEFPDIQQVMTGIEPKVYNKGMIAPDLLDPASYLRLERRDPVPSMMTGMDFENEGDSPSQSGEQSDAQQQPETAEPLQQQTGTSEIISTNSSQKTKIPHKTIALYHFYLFHKQNNFELTAARAETIATAYGWTRPNSGKKIHGYFTYFLDYRNRTTPANVKKSDLPKIRCFQEVIAMLAEYPNALATATDEMSLFISKITSS